MFSDAGSNLSSNPDPINLVTPSNANRQQSSSNRSNGYFINFDQFPSSQHEEIQQNINNLLQSYQLKQDKVYVYHLFPKIFFLII